MPAVPIYFENEDYEHSTPPISSNPTVTSVTSQVVLSGPTGSHRVPPFHLQEELRNDCAEEEDPKVESQLPSPSLSDLPSDHRLLNIRFVSYKVFHLGQSLFDCFALEMLRIFYRYIMYLYIISFVCMYVYIYICGFYRSLLEIFGFLRPPDKRSFHWQYPAPMPSGPCPGT